jgi:hypothetical protein
VSALAEIVSGPFRRFAVPALLFGWPAKCADAFEFCPLSAMKQMFRFPGQMWRHFPMHRFEQFEPDLASGNP